MPSRKKRKKALKAAKKTRAKGIPDAELSRIKKELEYSRNKSVLIEEDLKALRERLNMEMPAHALPNKDTRVFYKNFVFECGKCVKEFRHRTEVSSIYHKVVCPKCNEEHVLVFKPNIREYDLKLPKGIRVVRE